MDWVTKSPFSVDYRELDEDNNRWRKSGGSCFSSARPGRLCKYRCVIDPKITTEEIKAYLSHLKEFLHAEKFTFRQYKQLVVFKLDSRGMESKELLTYLTAFRMLDEYGQIIKMWFALGGLTPQERFQNLYLVYYEIVANWRNFYEGHALMVPYVGSGLDDPSPPGEISLEEYREKLNGWSSLVTHLADACVKKPKP